MPTVLIWYGETLAMPRLWFGLVWMCSVVPFAVRARCGLPGVTVLALFLFAAVDFSEISSTASFAATSHLPSGRKKASLWRSKCDSEPMARD